MSCVGPLHLLLRDGPQNGQRLSLEGEVVRFGRAPDNDVVLADASVSRHHGKLVWGDGRWTLHVEGMNAVRVNGRKVGQRSRALRDHDVVFVGTQPLFEVLEHGAEPAPDPPAEEVTPESRPRLSRRSALWIGIAAYLLFMAGLILFLFSLRSDGSGLTAALEPLSPAEIEAMLRRPPAQNDPYAAEMNAALTRARALTERLDARADKLFEAYTAFREAMATAPQGRLTEGRDILAYNDVRDRLTRSLSDLYWKAYKQFMSQQYESAERTLSTLLQRFPDTASPLHQSALRFLGETRTRHDEIKKRRRRGLF